MLGYLDDEANAVPLMDWVSLPVPLLEFVSDSLLRLPELVWLVDLLSEPLSDTSWLTLIEGVRLFDSLREQLAVSLTLIEAVWLVDALSDLVAVAALLTLMERVWLADAL